MEHSHRLTCLVIVLAGLLAITNLICAPRRSYAQEAPGLNAPEGQQVAQFAWAGEASLIAITYNDTGYSVFRVELGDGQWLPVSMPLSFSRLKPPGKVARGTQVDFALSTDGNGLAVLEHALEPLIAPMLNVYRWTSTGYRGIDTRALPQGFWPSLMVWDEQGQQLFLASREYLFPDQLYSIGALDSSNGRFTGVVIKGNIDLVDELVFLPQRQALAVRCRGYQGEYPEQAVIALIKLAARQFSILHSEADEHELLALANGELIVLEPESFKKGATWVLPPGEQQLSQVKLGAGSAAATLQITPDGQWLGYIADSEAASGSLAGELILQPAAGGQVLSTAQPCAMFAFAPNGRFVCVLDKDYRRFSFYQLPAG